MSEGEAERAMAARIALLREELRRDWQQVELHCAKAVDTDPSAGEAQCALVALSLDHAYQAFETMLLRVEGSLGLPERQGSAWHAALLDAARLPLAELRPPLLPEAAYPDWEALRRFRHFLRHAYAVPLDPEALQRNVRRLTRAVEATSPLVLALIEALG